jgi:hypothetical protein
VSDAISASHECVRVRVSALAVAMKCTTNGSQSHEHYCTCRSITDNVISRHLLGRLARAADRYLLPCILWYYLDLVTSCS